MLSSDRTQFVFTRAFSSFLAVFYFQYVEVFYAISIYLFAKSIGAGLLALPLGPSCAAGATNNARQLRIIGYQN